MIGNVFVSVPLSLSLSLSLALSLSLLKSVCNGNNSKTGHALQKYQPNDPTGTAL